MAERWPLDHPQIPHDPSNSRWHRQISLIGGALADGSHTRFAFDHAFAIKGQGTVLTGTTDTPWCATNPNPSIKGEVVAPPAPGDSLGQLGWL